MRILWTLAVIGLFAECGEAPKNEPPGPATGLWAHVESPTISDPVDRSNCINRLLGDYRWRACRTKAARLDIDFRNVSWEYADRGKPQNVVVVDGGRAAWVGFDKTWIYLAPGARPFITEIQGSPFFSGPSAYWIDDRKLWRLDAFNGQSETWRLPVALPARLLVRYAAPAYVVLESPVADIPVPAGMVLKSPPTTTILQLFRYDHQNAGALIPGEKFLDLTNRSVIWHEKYQMELHAESRRIVKSVDQKDQLRGVYYLDTSGPRELACQISVTPGEVLSIAEARENQDSLYIQIIYKDYSQASFLVHDRRCAHIAKNKERIEVNGDGSVWHISGSGFRYIDSNLRGHGDFVTDIESFAAAGPTTAWFLKPGGSIYRVELTPAGTYSISGPWRMPAEIVAALRPSSIATLFADPSGVTVWVGVSPIIARAMLVKRDLVWVTGTGMLSSVSIEYLRARANRLFAWSDPNLHLFSEIYTIEDLPEGQLAFGTNQLSFSGNGTFLDVGQMSNPPQLVLPPSNGIREVSIQIRDEAGTMLVDHWFRTHLPTSLFWRTPNRHVKAGTPLRVRLNVNSLSVGGVSDNGDPLRSLQAEWTRVVIEPMLPPWYSRPWSKGLGLALLSLLVILLLSGVAPKVPTLGQWLGLIVLGGGGAVAWRGIDGDVSVPVFGGALGGSLLLFGAVGALHPAILQTLGQIQPTRTVAQIVCRFPRIRRRMYAEAAVRVQHWLEGRRDGDGGAQLAGVYVSLPAEIESMSIALEARKAATAAGASEDADRAEELESTVGRAEEPDPAAWIARQMEGPLKHRPHVLVVGPAGCGKTALLRKVTATLLARHRESARNPLPVVLELQQANASIRESLSNELKSSVKSREVFDWAVAAGDYIVIVDGITERGVTAAGYQEFFQDVGRAGLRLLATARPSDEALGAFRSEIVSAIVRPRPLDDAHLPEFLEKLGMPGGLPEATLRACKQADGTYLPLFVRLAILAHEDASDEDIDVVGLFQRGVDRLLFGKRAADPALRLAAMKLAHDSYWIRGRRSFLLTESFVPADDVVKRLSESLLVSVGQGGREFRFAHDSLQVFLAAEQLVRNDHRAAFYEAATDAKFETTLAAGTSELPEMFYFCCLAFPSTVVREQLLGELRGWAVTHSDLLARAQVRAAMPDLLGEHVDTCATAEMSAGKILELSADWLEAGADRDHLELLYVRIARSVAEGQARWRAARS